eukprot:364721-Chlamydomonas_euryale.AAC.21
MPAAAGMGRAIADSLTARPASAAGAAVVRHLQGGAGGHHGAVELSGRTSARIAASQLMAARDVKGEGGASLLPVRC